MSIYGPKIGIMGNTSLSGKIANTINGMTLVYTATENILSQVTYSIPIPRYGIKK